MTKVGCTAVRTSPSSACGWFLADRFLTSDFDVQGITSCKLGTVFKTIPREGEIIAAAILE